MKSTEEKAESKPSKYYRVYAKPPHDKRFSAVDMSTGELVSNLIYATFFPADELGKLERVLKKSLAINKGWIFQIRRVDGKEEIEIA